MVLGVRLECRVCNLGKCSNLSRPRNLQSSCLSLPIAELLGLVNNGFHREGLVSLPFLTPHPCGDNLSQAHLSRSPTEFHGDQRTFLPSFMFSDTSEIEGGLGPAFFQEMAMDLELDQGSAVPRGCSTPESHFLFRVFRGRLQALARPGSMATSLRRQQELLICKRYHPALTLASVFSFHY